MSSELDLAESLFDCVANVRLALDIPKLGYGVTGSDKELVKFYRDNSRMIAESPQHDADSNRGGHLIVGDGEIECEEFRWVLDRDDVWVTIEVRPRELALAGLKWLEDFRNK